MAGMFSFVDKECVRVKVKKYDGLKQPEYKKFSVDPEITTFEVLQCLLAKAFHINGDFTISYIAQDDEGQETYLSLLSDWDLDAAFLSASEPALRLKVDTKPFEEGIEDDWDIVTPKDFARTTPNGTKTLAGTIFNQVGKTFREVQKQLGLGEDQLDQLLHASGGSPLKRAGSPGGAGDRPSRLRCASESSATTWTATVTLRGVPKGVRGAEEERRQFRGLHPCFGPLR